jgi:uncharacterized HAD superfamily protein
MPNRFLSALGISVDEDKPKAKPTDAPPTNLNFTQPLSQVAQVSSILATGNATATAGSTGAPEESDMYQHILAKTDFETTEVAATVRSFLELLQDMDMSPEMKLNTAIGQTCKKLGGEKVLAVFDGLKELLKTEQAALLQKADQFDAVNITAKHERVNAIQTQIQQLQQEQNQESSEMVEAQGTSAKVRGAIAVATQRRDSELDQQKMQYAAKIPAHK